MLWWVRWKMLATCKFGGSDQDWQFNPGKQKNQEEVEDGSSWSARSSHFVVEPLLPTRRLFKQKAGFEIMLWWVRWKMLATCKFGGSDQDWQFNPGKQKNQEEVEDGSSWSARSSHFVVEPLLPTRRLFKQKAGFEIMLWWVRWKMLATCKFGGSDQDWQFNPGKQKNQEEVEDGSSWSARSSHFVVEPLLPTRRLFKQKAGLRLCCDG